MKTIKLSLNALAALCFLVLFMTSCQDDAVENEVQPTVASDEVISAEQTKLEQLLQSVDLTHFSSINARTANQGTTLVYDFTVEFLSLAPNGPALDVQIGTLSLTEVDSIPGTQIIVGEEGVLELYNGTFTFTDATGQEATNQAFGIVAEDFSGLAFATSVNDIGFDVVLPGFVPGEDLSVPENQTAIIRVPAELNVPGNRLEIIYDADFVQSTGPEEETTAPLYELSIDVQTETDTLVIEGALELEPTSSGFRGTFAYTTNSGGTGTVPVSAISNALGVGTVVRILGFNLQGLTLTGVTFLVPAPGLAGEIETFSALGNGDDEDFGPFEGGTITVEGVLVEDPT